jgi:hypothetical protein
VIYCVCVFQQSYLRSRTQVCVLDGEPKSFLLHIVFSFEQNQLFLATRLIVIRACSSAFRTFTSLLTYSFKMFFNLFLNYFNVAVSTDIYPCTRPKTVLNFCIQISYKVNLHVFTLKTQGLPHTLVTDPLHMYKIIKRHVYALCIHTVCTMCADDVFSSIYV